MAHEVDFAEDREKVRKSKGAYGMKQPIGALTENFDLVLSVASHIDHENRAEA